MSTGIQASFLASLANNLALLHESSSDARGHADIRARIGLLKQQIRDIYKALAGQQAGAVSVLAGAEWLLDNEYVIEEALQQLNRDLPRSFYRQLPKVTHPDQGTISRVESLVRNTLEATRVPLDIDWLEQFTAAYQNQHVLKIGELWALPALLRLVILEQLCTAGLQLVAADEHAAEGDLSDCDTLAGCILTLIAVARFQWPECVERLSHVNQILARDPAGAFAAMDFATRNSYRNTVESIARRCGCPEWQVAEGAVHLAAQADTALRQHVGYFLVDRSRRELQHYLGYPDSLADKLADALRRKVAVIYVSGIIGGCAMLLGLLLNWLLSATGLPAALLLTVLAIPPAVMLCSGTVNWMILRYRAPRPLPKMEFVTGIGAGWHTAVAIPALLNSHEELQEIIASLETSYLGNSDPLLHFILLTDFPDAPKAEMPGEQALLQQASAAIHDLNEHYGDTDQQPFRLMHRRRLWNAAEDCWMGKERKRGKLAELNELLRNGNEGTFSYFAGSRAHLSDIRLVICLDADTHLTRGSARQLVGTLAHPLNRPIFDAITGRITSGYTIIQPRIEINPVGANATLFSRIFTGDVTFDLYTRAVSNIYQDTLGEGIFIGKGIYDLEGFTRSVAGEFPDNSILSHDLLEGMHGRAALAADIVLFENFPATLLTYIRRQHRWIRGDWQLCPWLGWRGVRAGTHRARFRAELIDRWMIFDNLSRSLLQTSLLALLIGGWLVLPELAWQWTVAVALVPGLPIILETFAALRPANWRWGTIASTLNAHAQTIGIELSRWGSLLVFLPYQSLIAGDAITRTLYRLIVSRKNLLEWTSAAQVARLFGQDMGVATTYVRMYAASILTLAIAVLVVRAAPQAVAAATPLLLAWLAAPLLAWWISRRRKVVVSALSPDDIATLRLLARRTWHFFESFVNPENQWLPPDNIQQSPKFTMAQRTSPSNIGFAMLSTLSAYDFGYLTLNDLCTRLANTLQTLQRVPKYRGHYLNWITTTDLRPLEPRYVSTVDSGNLAGCLIALNEGLQELLTRNVPLPHLRLGIRDTIRAMQSLVERAQAAGNCGDLTALASILGDLQETTLDSSPSWWQGLPETEQRGCKRIEVEFLRVLEQPAAHWSAEDIAEFRGWIHCLAREVHAAEREHKTFAPWHDLLAAAPDQMQQSGSDVWPELAAWLTAPLTLADVANAERQVLPLLDRLDTTINESAVATGQQAVAAWTQQLRNQVRESTRQACLIVDAIEKLRADMRRIVDEMNFGFLYDEQRQLFHIGHNASTGELDTSYYDLLASEARLASFIAIAQRQVPARHWVHLGRPLTRIRGTRVLLSWSATLFEYLMPRLLMESPERTLMNQSSRTAVDQAERYGKTNSTPWGISESGYYRFDHNGIYQYRAFGLPQLGLSRDQGQRMVIAPYASVLALPYDMSAVISNIKALRELGMEGQFGMREALDYGPSSDFRQNTRGQIVDAYMAHHQGMIMLALGNALHGDPMVRRFHADPRIAAVEPLLYEATPSVSETIAAHQFSTSLKPDIPGQQITQTWRPPPAQTSINIISNGHLHTRITSQGGGGQYWNDIALTRWDPDADGAIGGLNLYFKDAHSGATWTFGASAAHRPEPDIEFGPHMAMFLSRRQELLTRMTIVVAADEDVEIRKLVITNESGKARTLQVSLAGEPIMTRYAEFRRHPAFSRLFLESQFIADSGVLLFRRRPRSADQEKLYLGYALVTQDADEADRYFANDRKKFLGRRGDPQQPISLATTSPAAGKTCATADPWMMLGAKVSIPARASVQLTFLTSVADSQRQVLDTIGQFQSLDRIAWSIGQARTHSQFDLQKAKLEPDDVRTAMEVLMRLLWPQITADTRSQALRGCGEAQSSLWRHGISGDHRIIIMSLGKTDHISGAAQLLRCHTYWNLRGVAVDLVFIDETSAGYSQPTRDRLRSLIDQTQERHLPFQGTITVINSSDLQQHERNNLLAAAAVYLPAGTDIASFLRQRLQRRPLPPFVPAPSTPFQRSATPPLEPPTDLQFANGYGGFSKDGREYLMYQPAGTAPPAPWVNILANPEFGCVTTSAGLDFTWLGNSSEYRLTQWHNDPVTEQTSEALYLRDEETATAWSPTPLPMNDGLPYQVAHGAGYSRFEHNSEGLKQRVNVFVDPDESVKIVEVQLENCWPRDRRLTLTYVAQWVLGNSHVDNAGMLVPEMDPDSHALLVRNGFARHHSGRVAFLAASKLPHGVTTDLAEFLGPDRSWREPAGLRTIGLSGYVEPSPENCGAYQLHIDLAEHEVATVHFILGAAENRAAALEHVRRFQDPAFIKQRRVALDKRWDDLLGRLQITTPDPALNVLMNRWLPYQVLASRLWGRTGFYQPGGAFGFRDQLQDVLAFLLTNPALTRAQILLAAAVQFEAGDVLHWWHTDPLRGVRSRCSDDLLWLPYAVAEYLRATGDHELLDQRVAWLAGAELEPDEHERYAEYAASGKTASVYEHCCRAIDARLTVGAHGLPLIGTGDWNDGLNRVGADGQGESVWMAWFIYFVFERFAPVCEQQGDSERAQRYRERGQQIARAAEQNGWDGEWYLRGFYDDGDELGGKASDECRIDLNAQTWAGISGGGQRDRFELGMRAVRAELVDAENRLIRLLTPPFDKTAKDPGYIKGYPSGMRENGGQYNHAAVWAVWAMADIGAADTAHEWAQWLNPVYRASDQAAADHYCIEPYVMPGDISTGSDNVGRGGWSWYTGSAAWYYRLIVEKLLGLQWSATGFWLSPCVPADWPEFSVQFQRGDTRYTITVEQPGELEVSATSEHGAGEFIEWVDDGRHHRITMTQKHQQMGPDPKNTPASDSTFA